MQVSLTKEQARSLFLLAQVVEWEVLETEAKDDLRRIGVTEDEFDRIMYYLYDQTSMAAM